MLVKSLRTATALEVLSLDSVGLGDSGASELAALLRSGRSTLRTLKLQHNGLSNLTAMRLASALQACGTLDRGRRAHAVVTHSSRLCGWRRVQGLIMRAR